MLLNFVSMFIVAPLTTSMPAAYGIYSLCISFNIFQAYADLGFISAGRKYAAEAFSVNNHELEKKYIGTSIFIYSGMTLLIFLFTLFFAIYPELLIKDIDKGNYYDIAHQLLFILAFTFPFSIIQKFCSLVYSVRIEEYKIQSFRIIGSFIKILSVPLYFFNDRYDIVGYYLFCVTINLLINLIVLWYSRSIGYGFSGFLTCLKFDKHIFNEIKPLAIGGFVSVIGWVTYFELDAVGISVILGANAVAIYAVGKQIQSFIRSLVGIVFSPYPVRINYYIGQKDYDGLKRFFYKLVETFSIIIIPIVTIVLFAKPFVVAWVGPDYEESALILQLLVLTFILHHVTCQGASVLYGLNKVKDIMKLAFWEPFIFWVGVFATYNYWGVESFAIFKLVACLVTEVYYCYLVRKYLNYSRTELYWNLTVKPLLIITLTCVLVWYFTIHLLDSVTKGHQDLFYVVLIMAFCGIFSLFVDYYFNKSLRNEIVNSLKIIKKAING